MRFSFRLEDATNLNRPDIEGEVIIDLSSEDMRLRFIKNPAEYIQTERGEIGYKLAVLKPLNIRDEYLKAPFDKMARSLITWTIIESARNARMLNMNLRPANISRHHLDTATLCLIIVKYLAAGVSSPSKCLASFGLSPNTQYAVTLRRAREKLYQLNMLEKVGLWRYAVKQSAPTSQFVETLYDVTKIPESIEDAAKTAGDDAYGNHGGTLEVAEFPSEQLKSNSSEEQKVSEQVAQLIGAATPPEQKSVLDQNLEVPSACSLGEEVFVMLGGVNLYALVIGVSFTFGKVMYSVAIPADGKLPVEEWEYPKYGCLVNSELFSEEPPRLPNGEKDRTRHLKSYTKVLNIDSVWVTSVDPLKSKENRNHD